MIGRQVVALVLTGCLLAACADSEENVTGSTAAPPTTAASAAPTTTAPGTTAGPGTTAAPDTTAAQPTTSTVPASITPEVVCVRFVPGREGPEANELYFGYTSTGSAPVAVAPADSTLTGTSYVDEEAAARTPDVFAPGRVAPAFWVAVDEGAVPTWTVRGPDGQVRSAALAPDSPACPPTGPTATVADDRVPLVTTGVVVRPIGAAKAGGKPDAIDVTIAVEGLPEQSVCPPGLTPLPMQVDVLGAPGGRPAVTVLGSRRGTLTLTPGPGRPDDLVDPTVAEASAVFRFDVLDRCSGAGAQIAVRPSALAFAAVEALRRVRVEVLPDGHVRTTVESIDTDLPLTGGIRTRGS